jgi:Ca-activated chloride channel family protein
MADKKQNSKTVKILAGLSCAAVIIIGIVLIAGGSSTDVSNLTASSAQKILENSANKVKITNNAAQRGTVTYEDTYASEELPDIDKSYPLVLTPSGKNVTVEIFVSPEKAGTGTDGWMLELAKEFNNSNQIVDGNSVGVAIRSITSGAQIDYIESGVYVPDAISPSAALWCSMLENSGVDTTVITDKTVGNVAGLIVDNDTYTMLENQYGSVDVKTVTQATADGVITTGYTNPFASTTGLNFLASTLYSMDSTNPLSKTAIDGFNEFQNNVPFVAYNTLQMRNAAENNTFTTFILEYQTYYNDATLRNNYKFIPYGVRHDNPIYAVGDISSTKLEVLNLFADYCASSDAIKLAKEYGFNMMDDYVSDLPEISGDTWVQMQKLWKQNKNTSKPIAAVFVLDTSGSMSGEPLNALKTSLLNSIKYINSTNYVGVISYSTAVNVDLPIGLFDINQQSYFNGAVNGLNASGNTATFSALAEANIMLNEFMADNPNVQPMIFLLSDGQSNSGASLKDVSSAIEYFSIPVYTIGYNANLSELQSISDINEAASINADSDDVVYQLKNLFNANL